jgi:glycosyltransferase involved in cell wall biosynthesis
MARAVDEVIDNKTLRQTLIKQGHEQFKKYSWTKTAKQTHDIYLDALSDITES